MSSDLTEMRRGKFRWTPAILLFVFVLCITFVSDNMVKTLSVRTVQTMKTGFFRQPLPLKSSYEQQVANHPPCVKALPFLSRVPHDRLHAVGHLVGTQHTR